MGRIGVLVVCLTMGAAVPASAQIRINIGGKQFGPDAAKKKLKSLDNKLSDGFRALPKSYGKAATREGQGLDKAAAIASQVKGELSADLKMGGSSYSAVEKRIKALEEAVAQGRLQHGCSSARQVILNKNDGWIPATEADLKAFDDAVAAAAKGHKDPKTVAFWQGEAAKVRADQKRIAEQGAQKAARAAAKAKEKELAGVRKEANAVEKRILAVMKAAEEPIAAADLKAYEDAIAKIAAVYAPAAHAFETYKRQMLIYNAFKGGGGPSQVAQIMKGELVVGGGSSGKRLNLSVNAKAGHCYSMVTRWQTWTGGEKVKDFAWRAKAGDTWLQRYSISTWRNPWMQTRGFCATKDTKVSGTAELTFAGTRNSLEYAVVGWAKPQFPIEEATYTAVWKGDPCDTDYWKRLWTDPVPGSVVYQGKEPFIISSPDRPGQGWLTMLNVVGRDSVRSQKENVESQPPKVVAFRTQLSVPKCPSEDYATSKLSRKLAKCSRSQREKYDKLYDRARAAKENARTPGAWRAAKRRLAGLGDKQDREWNQKCRPTRKKIEKNFEKTYNAIVDRYADQPPAVHVDRAKRLVDEQ